MYVHVLCRRAVHPLTHYACVRVCVTTTATCAYSMASRAVTCQPITSGTKCSKTGYPHTHTERERDGHTC